VPSPADIAYLGFDPFVAAAVVCLVRRDMGSPAKSLWLDGALGAAGAATALAAVLSPVFSGIQGDLGEVLIGAAQPVADLVLIAMVCGLLAVRGLRGGSMWLWLAGGLTLFCAADIAYALRVASDTYVVGTVLDGLWAFSLMVMALGIWRPDRPRELGLGRSSATLAVPMLATLTAVATATSRRAITSAVHFRPMHSPPGREPAHCTTRHRRPRLATGRARLQAGVR
jgi:hypothetical protein